jgi:hypothetical protein
MEIYNEEKDELVIRINIDKNFTLEKKKKKMFDLISKEDKIYTFSSKNEEELENWILILKEFIK